MSTKLQHNSGVEGLECDGYLRFAVGCPACQAAYGITEDVEPDDEPSTLSKLEVEERLERHAFPELREKARAALAEAEKGEQG